MKEYKINKSLSLKLQFDKTHIYVKDRYFRSCMYLLLNVPIDSTLTDEIRSIDEAAETFDHSLERPKDSYHILSPEEEFTGHCSNLQAWAEHNYDTRLLHRNLAFSLLKKLAEAEDPVAKKVFKKEIAKRLEAGYPSVTQYLIERGYLKFLSREELESLDLRHKKRKLRRNIGHLIIIAEKLDGEYNQILKEQILRRILRFDIQSNSINSIFTHFIRLHLIIPEITQFFRKTLNDDSINKDHRYYTAFGTFFSRIDEVSLAKECLNRLVLLKEKNIEAYIEYMRMLLGKVHSYFPNYMNRDRIKYICNRLLEITNRFSLEMSFYFLSEKVLYHFWEGIKNTTDNVIAGLCASIATLCEYQDVLKVNSICKLLNVRMSTIQLQIKKRIFEKHHLSPFSTLVNSADQLKNFMVRIGLIEKEVPEGILTSEGKDEGVIQRSDKNGKN